MGLYSRLSRWRDSARRPLGGPGAGGWHPVKRPSAVVGSRCKSKCLGPEDPMTPGSDPQPPLRRR